VTNEQGHVARARETGRVTFLGLELLCHEQTLVPRAETELLARLAIDKLRVLERDVRVVDVCCGAGNIACAIAMLGPPATVWACDLTDHAVTNARVNVAQLELGARVQILQGDLLRAVEGLGLEGSIDLIACNPPYISTGRLERDRSALLAFEPREAFDGGPYGLTNHQRVINEALPYLRVGGWLALEVGLGQERQVDLLFGRAKGYSATEHHDDANGAVRVVLAQRAK
jgi:release factor glutamine methyltransferase